MTYRETTVRSKAFRANCNKFRAIVEKDMETYRNPWAFFVDAIDPARWGIAASDVAAIHAGMDAGAAYWNAVKRVEAATMESADGHIWSVFFEDGNIAVKRDDAIGCVDY